MSRLQQRLWNIMKAMRDDRNSVLHGEGNVIHQQEMRAIDQEIIIEWTTGLDRLPEPRYGHLFTGTAQQRLQDNIHQKQQWLCSVWVAQDRFGTTSVRERNEDAINFYNRWKEKLLFQCKVRMTNETIITEWNLGVNAMQQQYDHLFRGTLQERLGRRLRDKKIWIFKVWQMRGMTNDENVGHRNATILTWYQRWLQP